MAQPDDSRQRELRSRVRGESDLNQLLEILLALDRRVVEDAMRIYKVPRPDRFKMRAHNRRLHAVVREICRNCETYSLAVGLPVTLPPQAKTSVLF